MSDPNPKYPPYQYGRIADCKCGLHFVSPVRNNTGKWRIFCSNCGFEGPVADTPRYAIKAWNKYRRWPDEVEE